VRSVRRSLRRGPVPIAVAMAAAGALLTVMPASAQQLPQVIGGESGALIANGGFDVGDRSGHPINWAVDGNTKGAEIVNLSAYRSEGIASLQVDSSAGVVTVESERVVATAGENYTASAEVKGKSGEPGQFALQFTSFDGTVLATKTASPSFSPDWQRVTLSGTAPDTTAHLSLIITSSNDAGVSYWDQMTAGGTPVQYDPKLGSARELFLDNYRIASASNVGRIVHPADKRPTPVLRPDKPWENSTYIYGSVYKINGVYRMWYTCTNSTGYDLCYARSTDGVTWEKPLGVGDYGYGDIPASKTNIVLPGGGTVAYNPDAPADRRYAALTFHTGVVNKTLGYYAFFSPDGYHWTSAQSDPVLLDGDVSNVIYDDATHKYIATIKKRMFTARTPGTYERAAFISTSSDSVHWSTPQLAVEGDYADDGSAAAINGLEGQIYGMPVMPYESTYVGLPWVFLVQNFTQGISKGAGDGPVLPEIASSRNLVDWDRPVRDPVILSGEPGSWDDGTIYTASDFIVTHDHVYLYYGGFNTPHGGADPSDPNRAVQVGQTGMAGWRRDGFVSLTNASSEGLGDAGEVTTKRVQFTGSELHLNVNVRAHGSVRVELLDPATGEPLPGYGADDAVAVHGDQLDTTVHWRHGNSLASVVGREVEFRFDVVGADLYSYWVR
jgi:hypothetical protein